MSGIHDIQGTIEVLTRADLRRFGLRGNMRTSNTSFLAFLRGKRNTLILK